VSIDSISRRRIVATGSATARPTIAGTRHVVAAGHYLAAHAAFNILEAGGNAFDAGVAGGLVLGVVQSELVNIAGVAPIIFFDAKSKTVQTISGLGRWPKAITSTFFMDKHAGAIPHGLLRTVVPAAPDAWILALRKFGTMSFGEVASAAIRLARDGFVMYPLMSELISQFAEEYSRWPSSAAIYLPGGKPPAVGDIFVQADLARTLQYMADEEKAQAKHGREAGLEAARGAFYEGDIARAIVGFHEANGGLLRMEDMKTYRSEVGPSVKVAFGGMDVHACGPWCQGPALTQALQILQAAGIESRTHNSADYIHIVTEAIKLAFADRHAYFGDPDFIDVPLQTLLSPAYASERSRLIRMERASPGLPSSGGGYFDAAVYSAVRRPDQPGPSLDTSYIAVVDRWGNAFSATPSDVSYDNPVIPGTGLSPSSRGAQSWADPRHPSSVAPGKRPRLTPNPALAVGSDGRLMPFGTPGGDVQIQAMLQVLLNRLVFKMTLQEAVEAPRFATYSFPDSFEPHDYYPGRLNLETAIGESVAADLRERGHDITWWPDRTWRAGSVCIVDAFRSEGTLFAAADPRRPCYALGW
jgi:gamma-glutamyltranspeptidase/glutathione hydrolase